ncbi:unnamed protein product [Diatraea saccharalis]|uniref:Uncharacterized protein n=1 Tax=Diatraea saccharalis TaxID=40085 RepID=A0A9N9WF23_9NEOP|nr:unnamed protein product [Diatraea saccharalis]
MGSDSGGSEPTHGKKKRKASPLVDFSDDDEDVKHAPYFKKNHIRSYPENSPGTVFPVYIQSTNETIKFGNKNPIYLNNIFSRYNKGVKEIKRVNALRYAVIFDNAKNANSLLSNSSFLSLHEIKAFIPAATSECIGIIKYIPVDLSCKHLFDKLISSQEILAVRRFTRRTPDGIVPLQTVSVTFAGNVLPERVNYGLCLVPVEEYIKPVLQCYKCMGFGHTTKFCKRNIVCSICSESHSYKECTNTNKPLCINCKGEHIAVAGTCPVKLQKINENKSKIMNRNNLGSFFPALNKSYAKASSSKPLNVPNENNKAQNILTDVINNEKHNIQSLKPKLAFVCELLNSLKVDICILNETWLKPTDLIRIRGYTIFRRDSDNGYGGVAILCRNHIQCSEIFTHSTDKIQTVALNVQISQNDRFAVLGVYCPPRSGRFPINILKETIQSIRSPMLVMGDFNAHHTAFGCSNNKPRGIQIYDMLDELNMYILNDGQTTTLARPNQIASAIDIAFISPTLAPSADWSVYNEDTLGSYHFPTIVNLNIDHNIYDNSYRTEKFLYKKADWTGYTIKSGTYFTDIKYEQEPLLAYDKFCILLDRLRNEFIPVHKIDSNNKSKLHKPMPWWNESCSNAVKEARFALQMYRRFPSIENYLLYKKIEASKKLIIKQEKAISWKNLCSSFDRNTPISCIWRFVKILNHKNSSPKARDETFLQDFLQKIAPYQPPVNTDQLKYFFQYNEFNSHLALPFSQAEFNLSLTNKKDTSPGLDNIPYILIKRLDPNAKSILLKVLNDLWNNGLIPETWKVITVVPILKPDKDPKCADSYRPISLSSCVSKIFENMLKTRIELYAESRLILPHDQFGFRKGRSTIDSILKFCGDIQDSFDHDSYLVSTFLDVSGAFDNVDLSTLVEILHSFNIPGKICKWIFNFFYSRTVFIKFNNSLHGPKTAFKGLPQGATLSPLIYLLYTSQIHRFVSIPQLSVLQYADDIVLYTSNKNLLQAESTLNEALRHFHSYYKDKLKLDINPNKSSVLVFNKKNDYLNSVNIVYSSVNIATVQEKVFLGLVFDTKLNFDRHVNKIVCKMQRSVNIMRHLASVTWGMDPKILNILYKAIVRSHYDYALVAYGNYINSTLFRKLEIIQNRGLRIITGAICSTPINSLEIEAGIPPIYVRFRYLFEKMFIRILANKMYCYMYECNQSLQCEYLKELKLICKHIDHRVNWDFSTTEIHLTTPKVCHVRIVNNTEFLRFIDTEKPAHRKIYTDGSKTEKNTKAAYYDSKAKFGRCFSLDINSSIFTAEAYAIYTALQYIRGIRDNKYFLIITDSLSVLTCLENVSISYKNNTYITKIRELLMENLDKEIEFLWVPSHSGITGNETVDKLMKIEHPILNNNPYLAPPVPLTDYNAVLKCRMYHHWHEMWENTKLYKGNWYAQIQKRIPPKPWYFKWKFPSRKFITTINRLRFGHGKFPAHLKRIKIVSSDICEYCESTAATLDHLILHCPAFNVQRLLLVDGLMKIYKDEDIPRLLPSLLENEDTIGIPFFALTVCEKTLVYCDFVKSVNMSLRCINCDIRVTRIRRHLLSNESEALREVIRLWTYPREITNADYICHACWELANAQTTDNVPNQDRQVGHQNICVGCGRSILRLSSRIILRENPATEEGPIVDIISQWIHPRQLTAMDQACTACWLRAQRTLRRQQCVDEARVNIEESVSCINCNEELLHGSGHILLNEDENLTNMIKNWAYPNTTVVRLKVNMESDPPDPPDPPDIEFVSPPMFSQSHSLPDKVDSRKHKLPTESTSGLDKRTRNDNDIDTSVSVQTIYTHPSLSQVRKYGQDDRGPFVVHVSRSEPDPAAGTTIRPIKFGQTVHKHGIKNIVKGGIRNVGRNRIEIEFTTGLEANKFVSSDFIIRHKYKASIPTYNITRMGVVRNIPVDWSLDEFIESVDLPETSGKILKARRLNRKTYVNDKITWTPTQTVVLTFEGQLLPKRIYCYSTSLPVETYQLPTIQCHNCCRFGHIKTQCRSKPRCYRCTKEHSGEICPIVESCATCLHCSGGHFATDRGCPEFARQHNIKIIMSQENVSYLDASARFAPVRRPYSDVSKSPKAPTSLQPQTLEIQSYSHLPSSSISYRKTIPLPPRKRPSLTKGYDQSAHQAVISEPPPTIPNGSNLENPYSSSSDDRFLEHIISLLTDILFRFNDALPPNVAQKLNILTSLLPKNGSITANDEHQPLSTMEQPEARFRVRGFACLRDDKADGYDGCALLIKQNLTYYKLPIPPHNDLFNIIATRVMNITFVSIYLPHPHISIISDLEATLKNLPSPVIILGDFNTHHTSWGSYYCDSFSPHLIDLFHELDVCILNDGSLTRRVYPNQDPRSAVDLSMCSTSLAPLLSWKSTLETYGSDHFPLIISKPDTCIPAPFIPSFRKFNTRKVDWIKFSEDVDRQLSLLNVNHRPDIEELYSSFTDALVTAATSNIPIIRSSKRNLSSPPWWDAECSEIIKLRKRAEINYNLNMSTENFIIYKQISAKAKRLFKNKKKSGWHSFCESLSPSTAPSKVWRSIKRFRGSFVGPSPSSNDPTIWLESFANKLAPPFVPFEIEQPPLPHPSSQIQDRFDCEFSLAELNLALKNLKDSSPGEDHIPYTFASHLSSTGLTFLLNLYNYILNTGTIPSSWKSQIVIPILKPSKNPIDASSYRPIALSSTLCKILEHMIKNRLEWLAENRGLLAKSQSDSVKETVCQPPRCGHATDNGVDDDARVAVARQTSGLVGQLRSVFTTMNSLRELFGKAYLRALS